MKKLFFILLAFASITTFAQKGDYDIKQRASYAIQTDSLFIYKTDTIPASDISYHEWSSDLVNWHKEKEVNDQYLRISNDVKRSWVVIDYRSTNPYWLEGADDILYLNPFFTDKVFINATLLDSIWDLYVGGNINTDGYYFFGQDSLTHTNIYNGGTTDGWVLTASGDTAIWSPFAPGVGGRDTLFISRTDTIVNIDTILFAGDTIFNVDTIYVQGGIDTLIAGGGFYTARNVGIDGYGVLQDTTGNDFKFRNIATQDTFINVVLADSTLYLSWDGSGRRITAGIGLNGGGALDNDVTINFDIPNGFPTFPPSSEVDASSDFLVIYDVSAGIHYKINPSEITGTSVDLFTDDVFRESDIDTLNLVAGTLMDIEYEPDGRVIFNANTSSPTYVHIPDAFIAYGNRLFTYDISEGTAMSADGAPASDWSNKKSFGRGNYIWTAVANTVYRYDIANDTTISVTPSTTAISWLVNASDGVYAIANGRAYYIDTLDLTYVDYGNTGVGTPSAAISAVLDDEEVLILFNDDTDKHSWKRIYSNYEGTYNNNWTVTSCELGEDVHLSFGNDGVYWWLYDVNNRTKLMEAGYLTSTSDNCLDYRADYMTYLVPSGETFTEGSSDAIITLESSKPNILSTVSTSYNIVNTTSQAGDYTVTEATLDRGIYVAKDNTVSGNSYWYEQAVNDMVFDIHVQEQLISEGFLFDNIGVNVLAGAGGGYTYFHEYNEDPKQFMKKKVYEVTNDLTHVTAIPDDVVFVYFDSNYTGTDPKEVAVTELLDLYVDSVLKQEDIRRLNIVAGEGIQVDYSSDANVVISATGSLESHPPVTIAEESADLASIGEDQVLTINRQDAIPVAPEYGYLYNWWVTQEDVAPTGWHVPTKEEWETLFNEIDTYDSENEYWPLAGGKLKETGFIYWDSPNTGATDEYGFGVLGAGYRDESDGAFYAIKRSCDFWSITESELNTQSGIIFSCGYDNEVVASGLGGTNKISGFTIRFIKDDSIDPGTVTDYDGNVYPTVKIGNQVWMAQNFRGTHYNDGSPIDGPNFTDEQWLALTTPAYCIYKQTVEEKFADIDHNSTKNKQGGDEENNEFYHLTAAELSLLQSIDSIYATPDEVAQIVSDSIAATSGGCNYTVQILTSNTDTLNVANGVNAILDISGNTTIRIEPTENCNTGNITVICDAAGYTLTFVGATMKFSPYVEATAGVITTTASAGALDVFSYYYDGTRIFINGTKAYE